MNIEEQIMNNIKNKREGDYQLNIPKREYCERLLKMRQRNLIDFKKSPTFEDGTFDIIDLTIVK